MPYLKKLPFEFNILKVLISVFTLFLLIVVVPSDHLRAQVQPETNREALLQLSEELRQQREREKAEIAAKITARSLPMRIETEDGAVYELKRFVKGVPEYYTTNNVRAAISTGTNHLQEGGRTNLNLTGEGMIIGEWDAGAVLATHQELVGRVVQKDDATNVHNHAVHVAGTLIASGVRPDARGMAPEATLWAHDWSFDVAEMAEAAADGLLISNHSYGTLAGWAFGDWSGETGWHWFGDITVDPEEDYKLGHYNGSAAIWDNISFNAPYYLIVKSAGNNRNDNHTGTHFVFDPEVDEWVESDDFRQPDGGQFGYNSIPTYGNSKNILSVGAVRTVSGGYSTPSEVNMSSFSSWGPTDDGRIKPDLVGDGVGLLSSNGNSNASYHTSSGTSMSGPNVAGSLLLIQQLHEQLTGNFMLSSSLRGIAIHTVDETGSGPGPDYSFGWGLLNTERAAEFLLDPLNNQIVEEYIEPGDTLEYEIFGDGENVVKATLAWIDPNAFPSPLVPNDTTPKLINDLDMRIIAVSGADSGTVYFPYILDPANPADPATKGDNFLDNVEVIDPGVLPAGDYIVRITHKNQLFRDEPQLISLLISSPPSSCRITAEVLSRENPSCFSTEDGTLVIDSPDGTGPLSFSATGTQFHSSDTFSDLSQGLKYYYVLDSLGCIGSVSAILESPEPVDAIKVNQVGVRLNQPVEERRQFAFSNSFQTNSWGADPASVNVTASLVVVDDGLDDGFFGCEELINGQELEGNIALASRGVCQFGQKAFRAEQAGASAIIIVNNEAGLMDMGSGNFGDQVSIPVFLVDLDDGEFLLGLLSEGNVEMSLGQLNAVVNTSCPGSSDGILSPFISGGVPPYSFEWSTGDTTEVLEGVASGTYLLELTDSKGCQFQFSMDVDSPDSLSVQLIESQPVSCLGESDGSVLIEAVGGTPPYEYLWSNGQEGPELGPVSVGWYYVTATDANGCSAADSFQIRNPDELAVDSVIVLPACPRENTGKAEVLLSGGTGPFIVSWSHGADSLVADSLGAGFYSFVISDVCGTQVADSIKVPLSSGVSAAVSEIIEPQCGGEETGQISVEVQSDVRDFQIFWSHGDSTDNLTRLGAGLYGFTVTDACGVSVSDSVLLEEPDPIRLAVSEIQPPDCPGGSDGAIELSLGGGTGPLIPFWNTGDTGTTVLTALEAGIYSVVVIDSTGCSANLDIELIEPRELFARFSYELDDLTIEIVNESDSARFFWTFGDGATSTEREPVHEYSDEGEYEVCMTAVTPCDSITLCSDVQVVGSSVEDLELNPGVKVFPNPAASVLHVEIDEPGMYEHIRIYSSKGQLVKEKRALSELTLDVSDLPPGVYFMRYGPKVIPFAVGR